MMADEVMTERIITDYEGIEPFVDDLRKKVTGGFVANGRNDTLFKLVVVWDPSEEG